MRSALGLGLAVLWMLGAAAPAPAAAEDAPAGYSEAIRGAVQEYQAGNWTEATMLFRRAHALAPSARTHRGLGLCYFEARKYVLAVEHLQAALDDTRRSLSAAQRAAAQQALSRARTMVGEVVVHASPVAAQVLIDGDVRATVGRAAALDAGPHTIEVRAAGYATQQRKVDVVGEQRSELLVELERRGGAAAVAAAPSASPGAGQAAPADADGSVPVGPIAVLGVGVAALGGSLVTGLLMKGEEQTLIDHGCEAMCGADNESTRQRARDLQIASNVLLAGGAALTVAGALWLWLDLAGADAGENSVGVAALCTGDGCGGTLRGSF
jgi:PEGA domain